MRAPAPSPPPALRAGWIEARGAPSGLLQPLRASTSSGETLMPSKSRDFFSRAMYSMVRLASTSTKIETCGALKALDRKSVV